MSDTKGDGRIKPVSFCLIWFFEIKWPNLRYLKLGNFERFNFSEINIFINFWIFWYELHFWRLCPIFGSAFIIYKEFHLQFLWLYLNLHLLKECSDYRNCFTWGMITMLTNFCMFSGIILRMYYSACKYNNVISTTIKRFKIILF